MLHRVKGWKIPGGSSVVRHIELSAHFALKKISTIATKVSQNIGKGGIGHQMVSLKNKKKLKCSLCLASLHKPCSTTIKMSVYFQGPE